MAPSIQHSSFSIQHYFLQPCNPAISPIKNQLSAACGQGCVKFNLIDKIEELSERRIVAIKNVSLAEEYLADHFPTFPVLPGVLMVEAAVQAASWLLHHRNHFSRSMAVLKEARNVKYGQFVAPGNFLRIEVDLMKPSEEGGSFKATGSVGEEQAVQMRLEMVYFNLAEKSPELAKIDARLAEENRRRWEIIQTHSRGVSEMVQLG